MWQIITNIFVGLFRGWYGEKSRDKAHEGKGKAEARFEQEKKANDKITKADSVTVDNSPDSLLSDPNNRDN